MASGKKKMIKSDKVKILAVPHYEFLTVKDLLGFAREYPAVMNALPIEKEIHKLTRQYLINVIYTIVGDNFVEWVNERVEKRNKKIKEEGKMMIDIDPEVA